MTFTFNLIDFIGIWLICVFATAAVLIHRNGPLPKDWGTRIAILLICFFWPIGIGIEIWENTKGDR